MRAIIYCRVSSDPHHRGKSVDEQERECRALADAKGWTVGDVLVDNDRGASRYSRKDRPAYRKLADTLTDGDVLVTWEASRAQRDLRAYLDLRELCADRGVLWCYSGKVFDLSHGDDRFTTGLDALLSEKEVEQTRERVLRASRARAASGKPHGKLPYGYAIERDPVTGESLRRVPDPVTAPVVREIGQRVLAGESIRSIYTGLNAQGVAAPRPKRDGSPGEWGAINVRQIAGSPTYAGLRVYRGEILGAGDWEPIIDPDDHERIRAILADPARLTHRGNDPVWLLTGLAECAECGARLRRAKNKDGSSAYSCGDAYCVHWRTDDVDDYVTEAIIRRLESQSLVDDLADSDAELRAALDDARGLQQRLEAFTDSAADGELSPTALARIEAKLRPQIDAAEAKVRTLMPSPQIADMAGEGARERWLDMSVRDQRELLAQLATVRIRSVGRRQHDRAVSDCVEIIWR